MVFLADSRFVCDMSRRAIPEQPDRANAMAVARPIPLCR
jgi:hypothetical protein